MRNSPNLNLDIPEQDDLYNVDDFGVCFDKIDEFAGEIKKGVKHVPTLTWGMNNIRNNGQTPIFPYMRVKGRHYVNLLGKDGNCEDTSRWIASGCTLALDTTNKVYGANAIKATLTATQGYFYKTMDMIQNHIYYVSAFMRNGDATDVFVSFGGLFTTPTVTQTTSMQKTSVRETWTAASGANGVTVTINGSSTQYAFVDGVLIVDLTEIFGAGNEPTQEWCDTNLPYIDSAAGLKNFYAEVRRNNLVRNGNSEDGDGYWKQDIQGILSIENNKLKLTTSSAWIAVRQDIKLKPNTDYFIQANCTGQSTITITKWVNGAASTIKTGNGTFNSGASDNNQYQISIVNPAAGVGYADSIMLIEGTTAPTEYKSCEIERFALDADLWDGDVVEIKDGKVSGLLNWKHRTLYGKDEAWEFGADGTGYKYIRIPKPLGAIETLTDSTAHIFVKYDGQIIPIVSPISGTNQGNIGAYVNISISDTDTGWHETINPNADEVKAERNGWKACASFNNRYVCWLSKVDLTPPSASVNTATTSAGTSTTLNVTPGTGTNFTAGDLVSVVQKTTGSLISYNTVSSVTANTIVLGGSVTVAIGDYVIKSDNGSSVTTLLQWCKNNVAPNYIGDTLHYKLTNPEPVTDINVPVMGDLWSLQSGDNYVNIDSGMVLGEVVDIYYGTTYGFLNSLSYPTCVFKNKAESLNAMYKNNIWQGTSGWTFRYSGSTINGNFDMYIDKTLLDSNATYTVDYQILKTLHAQSAEELYMEYTQDIVSSVESVAKAVEDKQQRSTALDMINDLSLYEKGITKVYMKAVHTGSTLADLYFFIPYKLSKAVVPRLRRINASIKVFDNNGNWFDSNGYVSVHNTSPGKEGIYVWVRFNDSTVAGYAKNNGVDYLLDWEVDCRGRI